MSKSGGGTCPVSEMIRRLSLAGVPSDLNSGFCEVSGGKKKSYLPFTISTGTLTRGAKLIGSTSGKVCWNSSPPTGHSDHLDSVLYRNQIGASAAPQLKP